MNAKFSARIVAWIMCGVVVFQCAVVLGAPFGSYTQGGYHEGTLPTAGRAMAALSALLLIGMAMTMLALVGEGPLKKVTPTLIRKLAYATTIYSGLGVVMNFASHSANERLLWGPTTLVGFIFGVRALQLTR